MERKGGPPPVQVKVPASKQAGLNLRMWLGSLGPALKERQVKYLSRDYRQAMVWSLLLPKKCWQCDGDASRRVEFQRELRGFASPLGTVAFGGFAATVLIVLAAVFGWPSFFFAALAVLAVTLGILLVRSWTEQVRIVFWCCDRHGHTLEPPEMALADNDLFVFMPTPELAERVRAAILAERRKGGRYVTEDSTATVDPSIAALQSSPKPAKPAQRPIALDDDPLKAPSSGSSQESLPPSRPLRDELPPIKLDD